jgi:hypothetical protein
MERTKILSFLLPHFKIYTHKNDYLTKKIYISSVLKDLSYYHKKIPKENFLPQYFWDFCYSASYKNLPV